MDKSAFICVVTCSSCSSESFTASSATFEVRLGRRHGGNVHAGAGVDDELDETQRVRFFLLGGL
jgi:hypothetical protein